MLISITYTYNICKASTIISYVVVVASHLVSLGRIFCSSESPRQACEESRSRPVTGWIEIAYLQAPGRPNAEAVQVTEAVQMHNSSEVRTPNRGRLPSRLKTCGRPKISVHPGTKSSGSQPPKGLWPSNSQTRPGTRTSNRQVIQKLAVVQQTQLACAQSRPATKPSRDLWPSDRFSSKETFLILHKTGLFTYSIPQYLSRPTYSRPKRVSTILFTRFPLLFTSTSRFLKSIPHKVTLNFQLPR